MRARGTRLPRAAETAIFCAGLAAVWLALPAVAGAGGTEWSVLVSLAALYAGCELLPRWPPMARRIPRNIGAFFPVILAGAFLLPPAAAALVPVGGALAGRVEQRHAAARRLWHAAQLALAAWSAAYAHSLLPSPALTGAAFPRLLLPAAVAALTFCLVLTVLDSGILALAEHCSPRSVWRGQLMGAAVPHLLHGLAGLMTAVLWRSHYGPVAALSVLLPMYLGSWVFAQYHQERSAHQNTIRALVRAVDIKDRYTRGHSERVGRASVLIAQELGMEQGRTEALRFAGILHDVGKLGVPTRLLQKDGPLTPQERRVIQLHPEYGHEMVRGIGFLGDARSAILHHHERLDGSGYPYGLSGAQIPEFARVVAVADAFDAMTSNRCYSRARPVAAAVQELQRCAGSQFDPRMVRALSRGLDRRGWSTASTADTVDELAGPSAPGRAAEPAADGPRVAGARAGGGEPAPAEPAGPGA